MLLCLQFGMAQQWVQFSQQQFYSTYLNPAYTGFSKHLNATVAHRSQYLGLGTESIGTQYVSVSSPAFTSKMGLGFRLINDYIGLQRYTDIELTAAYHLLEKKHKLSFGLSGGLIQLGLKGNEITTPEGDYLAGLVVHNDNLLPENGSSGVAPTLSFGVLYAFKNWETGIAIQHLTTPGIKLSNTNNGTIVSVARTINIHSSYVIDLKNVKVTPSFFCKTDLNKWQAQVNLMLDWRKISAGIGFRGYNGFNNAALIGLFGFRVKEKLQVSYSYDYSLSFLNNSNSGSHEISLKFDLPRSFTQNVKSNIIFNPRYL